MWIPLYQQQLLKREIAVNKFKTTGAFKDKIDILIADEWVADLRKDIKASMISFDNKLETKDSDYIFLTFIITFFTSWSDWIVDSSHSFSSHVFNFR